ncbi:hypothetical protein RA19_04275 [Leisingera sp. ANG-M1]|uniref:DUF1493 family protein n=1 Tax=Leisingera sp. ANG-M1 TaxID=1577895 RepID=UPI00057DD296|nr:DUF1493 family protein [Leisingera sp. ANG-M1]KIC11859.1 hypothetical protein RA19_04275 [Leisingera sp. ANG-M1]
MGTALQQEILDFAAQFSGGKSKGAGQDDLLGAFGLEGDDANEFLDAFAERYGVDFSGFLWESHYNADEPPGRRRVLPLDVSGKIIPYQPITLELLEKAVLAGRWSYEYPEHTIKTLPFADTLSVWPFVLIAIVFALFWAAFE